MRRNNFWAHLFFSKYISKEKKIRKNLTSLFTWWGQGFKRLNRILLWRLMLLKGRWKVRTLLLVFSCPAKHNGVKSFMKEHSHLCAPAFSRDDFWKICVLFISMKIKDISAKNENMNAKSEIIWPHCVCLSIARIYRKEELNTRYWTFI